MPLDMRVQVGPNGWPGIFIPGDSAIFAGSGMRWMADAIEEGKPENIKIVADCLRRWAIDLSACYVKEKP
jgi:hypothetical protein